MTQARWWIGTINNPAGSLEGVWDNLKSLKARYLGGQCEMGEVEHTMHFQFVVNFESPVKLSALKKIEPRAHWEKTRSAAAVDYCFKKETRLLGPWEFGHKPVKRNDKKDWEAVWEFAKTGNFTAIPAEIRVKHYRTLTAIAKDHQQSVAVNEVRGIFLWGGTGTGKSYAARRMFKGPFYTKDPQNKWWDGYNGQPVVIFDDFGKDGAKYIGEKLKNWLDVYEAFGEAKGHQRPILAETIIITSNYSLEELFGHDPEGLLKPIKRRMRIIRHYLPFPKYSYEDECPKIPPISAEIEDEFDLAQERLYD